MGIARGPYVDFVIQTGDERLYKNTPHAFVITQDTFQGDT